MMASMVAKASTSSCNPLSPLSVQEKGSRNKRKFRADPPLSDPNKVLPSTLNDGPNYEFSAEKFEMATSHAHPAIPCDVCGVYQDHSESLKLDLGLSTSMGGSTEVSSSLPKEEVENDDFQDADWSDLTEGQLEELVLNNLDAIFRSAIKKIVACGYAEEVATKAVLRSGLCYGSKDTVSNIVDNAFVFLRNGQDFVVLREHYFENLLQLEKYVLAELVCVLREVRPFFSTGDAMWCLLICDMNVSHACAMDSDPLSMIGDSLPNVSSSSPPQPQFKAESKITEISLPSPSKAVPTISCNVKQTDMDTTRVPNLMKPKKSLVPNEPSSEKESSSSSSSNLVDKPFSAVGISHTLSLEEKFVSSRKIHSSSSKRDSTLRQKSLHLEKSYRSYGAKGPIRTSKFSGYILDKRIRPTSDSAGLNLKNASLKISKAMAMGLELAHENGSLSFSACSSLSSSSPPFSLDDRSTTNTSPKTDNMPSTPVAKMKPAVSAAVTDLSLSLSTKGNLPQVDPSCNSEAPIPGAAGIPYDKSLAQWVPQDKKDEMIMKLVPRIRELQHQLHEWTEWANQKVMQAARRLGKDKAELKTLRQEKEEVERLKKEKQTLEENTMKKLSEMENALGKASGQVDRANAAVRRLEVENTTLRQEMEAAKLRAAESAASCQEVSKREKKTLMKFQSWEKQKSIFQEELAAEKRKLSLLQQDLEQAKDHYNQLEARWKQEEKTKEELLAQANSIKKEREQLEVSAKSKEDAIKLKAEANFRKYKDDIQKLEKEITQLRLKTDSSKIAALKRGIDGSFASRLKDAQSAPAAKESHDTFKFGMANGFQEFLAFEGVKRERECVMCLSEEMSVIFLPCAHQVVCKMCNELHEKQGMNNCPSCRSPIFRRICVRFARP